MNRRIAVTAVFLLGVLAVDKAEAQSLSEQAAADALFEEGRRLRDAGDHAAACDRFEKSQSIDPALGTLQNIGMCLEEQGKLVAALSTYQQLLTDAEKARDAERISVARAKLKTLRRTVPKLNIRLHDAPLTPGLEVFVNSERLKDNLIGLALPVDPGQYVITAQAPNREHWTKTITLELKQTEVVTIPRLPTKEEEDNDKADAAQAAGVADATGSLHSEEQGATSVAIAVGPAFLSIGDLDITAQVALSAEVARRVRSGLVEIEVGGLFAAMAISSENTAGDVTDTRLFSLLATVTVSRRLRQKWRLRAQGGAGLLFLQGLDKMENPLLKPGVIASGGVRLLQGRVALGFDYAVTTQLLLALSPVVYWYSPKVDQFASSIDNLTGFQSMAGASYRF